MLRIDSVRKAFGAVQALDGISLTVRPSEVFGFLGANGAGKTTTMRIVLGSCEPMRGPSAGRTATQPVIDQLVYLASLYGMSRSNARLEARAWLKRLRIAEFADRKAESLSKGNQQTWPATRSPRWPPGSTGRACCSTGSARESARSGGSSARGA